jgi:hypothetical protein
LSQEKVNLIYRGSFNTGITNFGIILYYLQYIEKTINCKERKCKGTQIAGHSISSPKNPDLTQFLLITNSHFCHTDFAPVGFYAEGHMLEVVIVEKDTLEVIDDDIDGSV